MIFRASLRDPQTSGKNGTGVTFIKIYMEIQITDTGVMLSQNFILKIS